MIKKENKSKKGKEELMLEILKDAKEILDKINIEYWIDWGTLLGAIRDKKIIEYDDDIDISTFSYNWANVNSVLSEFEKKGFKITDVSRIKLDGKVFYEKIFLSRSGFDLDLWFYQLKNETFLYPMMNKTNLIARGLNVLHYVFSNRVLRHSPSLLLHIAKRIKPLLFFITPKSKKVISQKIERVLKRFYHINLVIVPAHYFKKLDSVNFYGMNFNIPSNIENYLKCKYGENWKTPNKNFDKIGMVDYEDIINIH